MSSDLGAVEANTNVARAPRDATRSQAPVFVLGCGRSGTKFLYHTLLSAGGFAVYHAESNAFNLIGLRFGDLSRLENRRQMLDAWLSSKLFERSGLPARKSNRAFSASAAVLEIFSGSSWKPSHTSRE